MLGSAVSGLTFARSGRVESKINGSELSLSNDFLQVSWSVSGRKLRPLLLQDRESGRSTSLGSEVLTLTFADGRVVRASEMALISKPLSIELKADPRSRRRASRMPGKRLVLNLEDRSTGAVVKWSRSSARGYALSSPRVFDPGTGSGFADTRASCLGCRSKRRPNCGHGQRVAGCRWAERSSHSSIRFRPPQSRDPAYDEP